LGYPERAEPSDMDPDERDPEALKPREEGLIKDTKPYEARTLYILVDFIALH